MRKFYKGAEQKWSCSKDSFKVVRCQGSWEISGENDDSSCTEPLSSLNQLPADAPVLLKQIKWK